VCPRRANRRRAVRRWAVAGIGAAGEVAARRTGALSRHDVDMAVPPGMIAGMLVVMCCARLAFPTRRCLWSLLGVWPVFRTFAVAHLKVPNKNQPPRNA